MRLHLVWTNLQPKLIPLLEANRALRLDDEKMRRKNDRKIKLDQLLKNMKLAEPPCIDAQIPNLVPPLAGPHASTVQVCHQRLFPTTADLLVYPLMKTLDETDVTASEMEARFKEHREEIDAHISEWRLQTEGHLAELLRKGRVSDGLEEKTPPPILPVEESEPNPFDSVSDDLKILLRADSLFESSHGPYAAPVTYYALISPQSYSGYDMRRGLPLDLTRYKREADAQMIARALLSGLGKPDACFLEIKSVGSRFMCGRCHNSSYYSWEGMVRFPSIASAFFLTSRSILGSALYGGEASLGETSSSDSGSRKAQYHVQRRPFPRL